MMNVQRTYIWMVRATQWICTNLSWCSHGCSLERWWSRWVLWRCKFLQNNRQEGSLFNSSWIVSSSWSGICTLYERPKEWELIPEYWRNMCKWVSVSIPLQIMLGLLFIIVQVNSLLGYLGKFDYFVLPQECSHIWWAHNLFLPAWYIDSYIYWDVKLVPSP